MVINETSSDSNVLLVWLQHCLQDRNQRPNTVKESVFIIHHAETTVQTRFADKNEMTVKMVNGNWDSESREQQSKKKSPYSENEMAINETSSSSKVLLAWPQHCLQTEDDTCPTTTRQWLDDGPPLVRHRAVNGPCWIQGLALLHT